MAQSADRVDFGVRVPVEARDAQKPAVAKGPEQAFAAAFEPVRSRCPFLDKAAHEIEALSLCLDDKRPQNIERVQPRDPNRIHAAR